MGFCFQQTGQTRANKLAVFNRSSTCHAPQGAAARCCSVEPLAGPAGAALRRRSCFLAQPRAHPSITGGPEEAGMYSITLFDSTKEHLQDILRGIREGKTQLPDFQRGWVWDDSHLRSLLASVSINYPIGAVMMLQTGNPAVRFK